MVTASLVPAPGPEAAPTPAAIPTPLAPAPSRPVVSSTASAVGWVLVLTAIATVAAWCGWRLDVNLRAVISPRAFTFGSLYAFAPVVPMVLVFVLLNRFRPEPARLLVIALVWGTFIATYFALRLNSWLASQLGNGHGGSAQSAVFIAPWVEEACKATVIFAIAWWRRHDFNGVLAGVVYGGLSGIGFAFTENVVYYGQIFQHVHDLKNDNGAALDAVQSLFLWRGVAAPFIHPMFTMMTGIGIGIAVRSRHVGVRVLAPAVGFCAAVLLHMGYNTAASFAVGDALIAVYLGMLVPTLLILATLVLVVARDERRVIAARLSDYTVYGWLRDDEIPYLVSMRGRRRLRQHAKLFGRAEQTRARTLQRAGVDLGVLRDRMVRGVAGKQEFRREAELMATVRDLLSRTRLPDGAGRGGDPVAARSSW